MNFKTIKTLAALCFGAWFVPAQADYGRAYAAFNQGNYQESLAELKKCPGDMHCLALLAVQHLAGVGTPQNDQEGVHYMRLSAEKGHAKSQIFLGQRFYFGEGTTQDFKEAFKWYDMAAKQGEPEAQYRLSDMYFAGQGMPSDPKRGLRLLELAAMKWHDKALHGLGIYYSLDEAGDKKDYKLALEYLNRAVAIGYAPAYVSLGEMYLAGKGVSQSEKEALRQFREAARLGERQGQYRLGLAYDRGAVDGKRDAKEAVKWYLMAAEQGLSDAKVNLASMMHEGAGMDQDYDGAYQLFEDASTQGNGMAFYNMAQMQRLGQGKPQNLDKAVELYLRAADLKHAGAMHSLGVMFNKGEGVPQNHVLSYAIHNLGASIGGQASALISRNRVGAKLQPEQISTAQLLASEMYKGGKMSLVVERYLRTGK